MHMKMPHRDYTNKTVDEIYGFVEIGNNKRSKSFLKDKRKASFDMNGFEVEEGKVR